MTRINLQLTSGPLKIRNDEAQGASLLSYLIGFPLEYLHFSLFLHLNIKHYRTLTE